MTRQSPCLTFLHLSSPFINLAILGFHGHLPVVWWALASEMIFLSAVAKATGNFSKLNTTK
eukprot:4498317-Amphidinium_carterae.1